MLKSNKGKPVRYLDGYSMLHHYNSTSGTVQYSRCSDFKTCPARAKLTTDTVEFRLNAGAAHNHVVDPVSPTKRQRRTALKDMAAANMATPSGTLAADAQVGLSQQELQAFPTLRALQKVVNYSRKDDSGGGSDKEPSEIILPHSLKKTLRGDRFLLVDSRANNPDAPVFLAFASDAGAELLRENKQWCLDATFWAAPKHFDSLLTICAMVGKSALPAVYVVLPNRLQANYERAISEVFGAEPFRNVVPDAYICDFEAGMFGAMKKQFPHADCEHCYFHLCKNGWLHVQKKGLLPVYSIPEARVLLRCFPALAFLPEDEVGDGYDDICFALSELVRNEVVAQNFVEGINKYAEYFGNTYTGRVVGTRMVRPRFYVKSWNVFGRTLEARPRTNNGNEGWNASLNQLFSKHNPVMSRFLAIIIREEERTINLVQGNNMNPGDNGGEVRGRQTKVSKREANLRALVAKYAETPHADRNRLQYLERVQYHLSETAFSTLMMLEEDALHVSSQSSQPTASQYVDIQPEEEPEQPLLPTQPVAANGRRKKGFKQPSEQPTTSQRAMLSQSEQPSSQLPSTSQMASVPILKTSRSGRQIVPAPKMRAFSFLD